MLSTMKLAVAVQPTQQQLVDYANAAAAVNLYAYAITNQDMPVLNEPPTNYGNFADSLSTAKDHCLNWTNSLFPMMLSLPQTIVNAADLFSLDGSEATQALQALVLDPTNTDMQKLLATALANMQQLVGDQLATVNTLVTGLNTFANNITSDASTLSGIATMALEGAGNDRASINQLNGDIASLNSDISTLQTWLTISEVGIGVSIFVGCVGAVVCAIPGAQGIGAGIIVVAVAGLAASIAGTVIANKKISADQQMITSDQNQISSLNQDIILLTTLNAQFGLLVTANQNAQVAISTVVAMWQNLDNILTNLQTELTQVSDDDASAAYAQAVTDLQTADNSWGEVVAFANALLNVNYSWIDQNGVSHTFGQTSPAADAGQVTNIA